MYFKKYVFASLYVISIAFSVSGQNLVSNPDLNKSTADCAESDAVRNDAPDSWGQTFTPDRSTANQRAWDSFTAKRGPSPSGGCYYGFRALGSAPEGISQTVNVGCYVLIRVYSDCFSIFLENELNKIKYT